MIRRKMLWKKIISVACVMALSAAMLTGCGGGNSESTDGAKGNESSEVSEKTKADLKTTEDGKIDLTTSIMMDPETLDPAFNYNSGRFEVLPNICEPMLKIGPNGELNPGICESYEKKDDVTYVYKVREGVKFSDGTDLTADDVAYCLNRIMEPETGSSIAWLMASVESIEKTGDYEVTVKLSKADASWEYIPATSVGQIYSKAACEADTANFGSENNPPVGAGAYKLESWNRGSDLILTANEYYYGGLDSLAVGRVTFKIFSDENALLVSAKNGEVDVLSVDNDLSLLAEYEGISDMTVDSVRCYTSMGVFFNTKREPLDDINLRKAIASALDEASYAEAVYGDFGETGNGLMYGSGGYGENSEEWTKFVEGYEYKYSYDMDKAKEYLAASEYPDGNVELTIIVANSMNSGVKLAQVVQAACKELGVTVNVEKMPISDYYSYIYGGSIDDEGVDNYDMCIMGWGPDYPDPIGCIQPLFESVNDCAGGANYSSLCDDDVDAAIEAQNKETDPAKRLELLEDLCNVLGEKCAYKMLAYPDNTYCVKNGLNVPWSTIPYWTFFVSDITVGE